MDFDVPIIYGLEFQARALTSHIAESELIQFFVGTQSLRSINQVHKLDFDEETNSINKEVYLHPPGEIWDISTSTLQKDLLATIYNHVSSSKCEMQCAIWRLKPEHSNQSTSNSLTVEESLDNAKPLEVVSKFDSTPYGDVKDLIWHPSGEKNDIAILAGCHLVLCDLDSLANSTRIISECKLDSKSQPKFTSGAWNPHHNCNQLATCHDTNIKGWDIRSMQSIYTIENGHSHLVRKVDFNPNKQYYMASCGDDSKTKFWDVRNVMRPVMILDDHSHWVWNVKYNHFHDQLVLTSSSDGCVILNNLASISSEPYGNLIDNDDCYEQDDMETATGKIKTEEAPPSDGIILRYAEHEDSVYGAEWSSADPWIFASLSYDGRLIINRVPRAIKYKILL